VGQWTDSIVNNGTMMSTTATGTMTLDASNFINNGGFLIGSNGNAVIADASFTNNGVIAVVVGSSLLLSLYDFYSSPYAGTYQMTNTGTIRMLGGAFAETTGNGLFPAVAVHNAAGALIQGLGTILAPIQNDGTIESKSGPILQLLQGVTGSGTMIIDAGMVLEVNGAVAASQHLSFAGTSGVLKLDQATTFGASITGFGGGNVIDMTSHASAIAVTGGALTATTAVGTVHLTTATPIAGEISASTDAHGGSIISYTAQSGMAVIPVTQNSMLFVAAAAGDQFVGPSWAMNGAHIGNFTSADSLDFRDMVLGHATETYVQGSGQGLLTVTDGTHTGSIALIGSFNASQFHLVSDGAVGTLVTYHS
jgi:hypothetical protein